jgi:nucleoside-diphosphate-sugar epimerase
MHLEKVKPKGRILITGATGFIGGKVLSRCLDSGFVTRVALRRQAELPCESIAVGDINGETKWLEALGEVETVIHLAAYAHVTNPAMVDRDLLRRTNVEGVANLALQALRAGVKQMIFLSSVGAMAESSEHMLSPSTPCNPTTHYGKSKLDAENQLRDIAAGNSMQWTIIRPPLVYGPGNPGNMRRLFQLVRSGVPLPLASVRNRRSFVYVENLADLITACLGNPKSFGKTLLPSDGEDVSTPQLLEKIAQAEFERLKPLAVSGRVGRDRPRLFPFPQHILKVLGHLPGLSALRKLTSSLYVDSKSLRRHLDWTPPFAMDEGLRRTLAAT